MIRELSHDLVVGLPQFKSRFSNFSVALPRLSIPRVLLSFLLLSTVTTVQAVPEDYDFSKKDGTVINKANGLVWRLCHAGETFNGQTCTGEPRYYTGIEAVKLTDTFAGFNDWRLPTLDEIKTLGELIRDDPKYWPYLPKNNNFYQSDCAWSSTEYSGSSIKYLWVLISSWGFTSTRHEMDSCTVYLVRGSKTRELTFNADGTVTQQKTKLMWQTCPLGQTWIGNTCSGTAKLYLRMNVQSDRQAGAFKSNFATYNDWRLPKKNELDTIQDELPSNGYLDADLDIDISSLYISVAMANYLSASVPARLVRNLTTSAPSPAPAPTGFSITSNEYSSLRNSKKLAVAISGPASTNDVYVWAYVKTMGEFCYTRSGDWIPYKSTYTLSGGKGRCPTPARTLSNARTSIDVLWNADLSSPLFDQSRVFVTLEPAGSTPTAAVKNQKVMEFGGSAWQ